MDYSSLILMEKDNETGFVTKELGSFNVSEGAEYIKGFYVQGDTVYIKFDTNKDVQEWEYSAIYDMFNLELFEEEGFKIEEVEDEYNPTYLVSFKYEDKHEYISEKLSLCIELSSIVALLFSSIIGLSYTVIVLDFVVVRSLLLVTVYVNSYIPTLDVSIFSALYCMLVIGPSILSLAVTLCFNCS